MLVLTRKSQESIMIGKDIKVTILEIRGDRVRIGITAPNSITVHREEIWLQHKDNPGGTDNVTK